MINKHKLGGDAVAKALMLRRRLGVAPTDSVSPIESAEALNVEVRFIDLPSMEGIYSTGQPAKILLSSLRPLGRRNFTCAHELGHHMFGHGQKFDELHEQRHADSKSNPDEFVADCFASYFLMPKLTIENGMHRRGFKYTSLTQRESYEMANWLGVGYKTFIRHIQYGLKVIGDKKAEQLIKATPALIREEMLGYDPGNQLHVVNEFWCGRAVDCEIDDYILLPINTVVEGKTLALIKNGPVCALFKVISAGLGRARAGQGWASFIRSSRRQYIGRACHRFEEEAEE